MTAEVAVLNRTGVALAADSAVTITGVSGQKVYNTVNKLFGLSKFEPVGVMVYGSADLIGVHWEVIIKAYRRRLGSTHYDRLQDYSEDFQRYLSDNLDLFPPEAQLERARSLVAGAFGELARSASARARQKRESPEASLRRACLAFIRHLSSLPLLSGYADSDLETIAGRHEELVSEAIGAAFATFDLSDELHTLLKRVAGHCLCKAHRYVDPSGVVIAGYGRKDLFPSLVVFEVHYISDSQPRIGHRDSYRVTFTDHGCVFPFAQRELVSAFMEGIDPSYQMFIEAAVGDLVLVKYPNLVSEALSGVNGVDSTALRNKLAEMGAGIMEGFEEETGRYRQEKHITPITRAVGFLPKEELATLAEALVNLTSLKKRVTLDTETVGGPIDVVIISKGDGLVWMRRKHYFKADLNPHFFTNYFREEPKGE